MDTLDGFDYASFLKKKLFVGQVDPWRRNERGKPIYGLLVPLETAMSECKEWSGQDISKNRFVDHLKINDIWVLQSPDEFKNQVARLKEEMKTKPKKRQISEEQREILKNRMKKLNSTRVPQSTVIPQ